MVRLANTSVSKTMNSLLRARHACISFFARAFDFNGKSNRFDFWIVVLIYSAINIAIDLENTPNAFQNAYLALVFIPWLSLITRRLRDSGYKPVWLWRALIPFYILFQIWIILIWLARPSKKASSFSESHNEASDSEPPNS